MKKISVRLAERSYPISIGVKLPGLGAHLAGGRFGSKILVITNTRVKKLYSVSLVSGLKKAGFVVSLAVIPDGEKYKNLSTVERLYNEAVRAGLDRCSTIVALGGGVVGDIAGFVAATFMRGISFVQVPTTLLAMTDSSVGGKTGVDLKYGKNLVGAFYQPKAVWIDISTLKTLPGRELRNGLAEVIKYGVIADKNFFDYLKKNIGHTDTSFYQHIVERSCRIKAGVVAQDEREEKGVREILNFGHTFGHAIETATGYSVYSHGEAVAMGMNLAGRLAVLNGMFPAVEQAELESLIVSAGLQLFPRHKISAERILALMQKDKKTRDGMLRLVLPSRIGKVAVRRDVPVKLLREVLKW